MRYSCAPQKIRSPGSIDISVTRRFSPAGIRDAGRQELISLQLGDLLECNAVAVEALPSANSDPAFPVRGWNVDAQNCNEPSTPSGSVECAFH